MTSPLAQHLPIWQKTGLPVQNVWCFFKCTLWSWAAASPLASRSICDKVRSPANASLLLIRQFVDSVAKTTVEKGHGSEQEFLFMVEEGSKSQ